MSKILKYFNLDYSRYARQNYAPEYSPNGALFIAKPKEYLQTKQFYGERSLAYFMDKKDSIDIDDREDFEYFYFITQQRKRGELLLAQVKREVKLKEAYYSKAEGITLLGGSLLALWDVEFIGKYKIQNLAITASHLDQYESLVLSRKDLVLSPIVVIEIGRDDLRKSLVSAEQLAQRVAQSVKRLLIQSPHIQVYLLESLVALFRVDFDNNKAKVFNDVLRLALSAESRVTWLNLNEHFKDEYGKLSQQYTSDGLNLNATGYERLAKLLCNIL